MAEITFGSNPIPVHVPFHQSSASERALFGAFGSGKTYAIVDEAIAWCLEQPGIRGAIARKTVPELRDTTEPTFFERLPPELRAAGKAPRGGHHYDRFIFPNGSEVLFRSVDDWNKWRSQNLGFLAIDEANELDEDSYLGLTSRLRQVDLTEGARKLGYTQPISRRGAWLATNPNGKDWLWRRFVGPNREAGTEYFRSTSFDNPYLAKDTLDMYMSYPEMWIRRYVLCTFDEFGGQIYEAWNWDDHVIKPYALPKDNVVWMGMDPGTRNPTAGLWVHVDMANRTMVGVAEYEEAGRAAVEHGANWRRLEARLKANVRLRIADPNINTRDRGTNMELSDQYSRMGFYFQLGPRQHKIRIPALGQQIVLGRFKVTSDCPRTYEAIKNYRWEDLSPTARNRNLDPIEVPHKEADHLVDCAQYLTSRWMAPPKGSTSLNDGLEGHSAFSRDAQRAIRKQLNSKRRGFSPLGKL